MHIDGVPNRTSRPTYLLRESYREGKKVRKRTIANLSALSDEQIEAIRAVLAGHTLRPVEELWQTTRSRSHGAVQAVRVAMQRLGFESLIASRPGPERDAVCAMLAARILAPHTKLATTRWWFPEALRPTRRGRTRPTRADRYLRVRTFISGDERVFVAVRGSKAADVAQEANALQWLYVHGRADAVQLERLRGLDGGL